jgi:hypothetical protein
MLTLDTNAVDKFNTVHAYGQPVWVWTLYAAHVGYAHYKVGHIRNFDLIVGIRNHALENPDAWASFVAAQRIYNRNLAPL